MLEHIEGKSEHLFLLLDTLRIVLNAGLLVFTAKCSTCGTENKDTGVWYSAHKKQVCPCALTWVTREWGWVTCTIFALCLLVDRLVFTFPAGKTGHLASLMLEPSFYS